MRTVALKFLLVSYNAHSFGSSRKVLSTNAGSSLLSCPSSSRKSDLSVWFRSVMHPLIHSKALLRMTHVELRNWGKSESGKLISVQPNTLL